MLDKNGVTLMSNAEQIKNFWEEKHKIKDIAALSGCFYNDTLDFMQLNSYIKEGITVLEVGVGLGYVTKGLFDYGVEVSALDVSEVSLNRVNSYCKQTYNVSNIHKLPSNYFDVIICNNVVQHISTDILIYELRALIVSLKVDGIFAIEFVSNKSFDDNGVDPSLNYIKNGGKGSFPRNETMINTEYVFAELAFAKEARIVFSKRNDVDRDGINGMDEVDNFSNETDFPFWPCWFEVYGEPR